MQETNMTAMPNLLKKIAGNKIKFGEISKFSAELEKIINQGGNIDQKMLFKINREEQEITLLEYCVMTLKKGFVECLLKKGANTKAGNIPLIDRISLV